MTTNWFDWPDEPEPDPTPQVWTLADIYADLGTTTDIAAHLNIHKARLLRWIDRDVNGGCPRPVCEFGNIKVYSKQEWADWFVKFQEGKKPGTKWTNRSHPFKETRISKLDPNFRFGNPGLNNMLADWREAKKRAKAAEAEAESAD